MRVLDYWSLFAMRSLHPLLRVGAVDVRKHLLVSR